MQYDAGLPGTDEGEFLERLHALIEIRDILLTLPTVDDLCRQVVELGLSRLGFDRMSIWFTTDVPSTVQGSYGVDEQGNIRDERDARIEVSPETEMGRILSGQARSLIETQDTLYDHTAAVIGEGAHAIAALWDGRRILGCVSIDNHLTLRPLTRQTCALLDLYAATIGHLYMLKVAEVERERLEEQLRQSQKLEAIGRLAGGIAHDFNNLLTPICGYAELASLQLSASDSFQRPIQQILQAGRQAANLTRQLLAFSRKQLLTMQQIDLSVTVHAFLPMLQRIIGEDIEIVADLAPGPATILADTTQIQQILMNLAANARDAMPGGGTLRIATAHVLLDVASAIPELASGRYLQITVSDTGEGMDAGIIQHIFEPFFTTKAPGKGTGLGLATTYGIVKQHGGHITLHSEPGHGTTFNIYLPQVEEESELQPIPGVASAMQAGKEVILLVEDEALVRKLVIQLLMAHGYTLLVASEPLEALQLVATHQGPIHLLLTDIVMPHMNGLELYRKVGETRPEMKVVFMSGYAQDVLTEHGMPGEELPYLAKPFTVDQLLRAVRETLEG